ncbi:MAG: type II secretion system major pseudopilin GspG [Phycisphaerales bacterium]
MKRSGRLAARSAFSIMEILVVIVIIGVLAAVIAPRIFGRVGQSKQAVARTNVETLASSIRTFTLDHGAIEPGADIMILWERPSNVAEDKYQPYVDNADALLDPWGNKYVLLIPGQFNVDFDVVSYGIDGQPGGEGEAKDVVNGKKD